MTQRSRIIYKASDKASDKVSDKAADTFQLYETIN